MEEIYNAITEWFKTLWTDTVEFFTDLPLIVLDGVLSAFASLIASIPTPAFLANGLDTLLDPLPSSILYFLAQSGFSEAIALVGAGVAFRLSRKVFTLFQW